MRILAQFPTLGRPEQFLACLTKYVTKMSGKHHVFFNINCDADDPTMKNQLLQHKIRVLCGSQNCDINFQHGSTKISAINSYIDGKAFDIVICISDDMNPMVDDWDNVICADMAKNFPQLDGALNYNDGRAQEELITFSILGRRLYEHFGYIYHPDYKVLYCDNEFTEEVTALGKVVYIEEVVFQHDHYAEEGNINSGKTDHATAKTLRSSGRDAQVYQQRKMLGYPKERVTND